MNIQKIVIALTMLLMANNITSMQTFKKFFDRDLEVIKEDIEKTRGDESLTDFQRHINLSALNSELHDAYTSIKDYDDETAKQIDCEREKHKLAAQEIRKKENKIKSIEARIKKEGNDPQRTRAERLISLISDYQELTRLNPAHTEYQIRLHKLENIKLRKEVEQQIVELEKINNKEGLLRAYKSLITTFQTEEKIAPYRSIIASLETEVAEEQKIHRAEILRAVQYTDLSENINSVAKNKQLSDLTRKMQLASLLTERAKIGKDIECYATKAEDDAKRARCLGYEALALAKTTKDTAAEKSLMALIMQ